MPSHFTRFSKNWLSETDENGHLISKWCSVVEDDSYSAHCFICKKTFEIKNAGRKQILQHARTVKHKKLVGPVLSKKQTKFNISVSSDGERSATLISAEGSKEWNMTEDDKITNAEVLWSLKVVKSGYSFKSCDDIGAIFRNAFSDSQIAKSFALSSTKVAYELCHGLGPFFHDELLSAIIKSGNCFSLSFDEATTDVGKKQLDLHVRFWNEEQDQIVCHFLRAFELGHATSQILKEKLLLALSLDKLPLNKLLAISSDGPPVNHKCLNEIDKSLKEQGFPPLVKIGTCNLHIAHNSFRHAMSHAVSHWNIDDFLDAVFKFLHKFPARKEDFQVIQVEIGTKEQMMMMFVSNRWLTLVSVIIKVIEQWAALKEYFLKYIPDSKNKRLCQTQSYQFIKSVLQCPSTLARLYFLKSVGESFEKFMKLMQLEEPLIHILYDELCSLIKNLLSRIVKPEKLQKKYASKLHTIDLTDFDNILPLEKIDVGFLAKKEVLKLQDKDKKVFYMDAKALMTSIISYLREHLPLNNILLKNIHCFHPCLQREQRSLDCLQRVIEQMPAVVKKEDIDKLREEWKLYMLEEIDNMIDEDNPLGCKIRIDSYWSVILKKKNFLGDMKYPLLSKLVKAVLSLYHGQADIERGFSINRQFVKTSRASLNEKTINSLHTIEAEIRSRGGDVTKVPLSPRCFKAFIEANKVYKEYMESCKKEEEEKKASKEKRKCDTKYKSLQERKIQLQEAVDSSHRLIGEANSRLSKAIENNNMAEVHTAQALLQSGHKLLTDKGDELRKVEFELSSMMKLKK